MIANSPERIQELEKYLPFMSEEEREEFFLCSTDTIPINFSEEQELNWERQINERNAKIQEKFDTLIKKNMNG